VPHNHRMQPIGDNHRPTPRLAKLLLQRASSPEGHGGNPFLGYVLANDGSQNALNQYRTYRDISNGTIKLSGRETMVAQDRLSGKMAPASEDNPLPAVASTVNETFKNRHKK
jgi:hypothetical protein